MEIGVSSACLYPMELEQSVQTLLDGGVKTLELFVNAACELEPDFVCGLRDRVDRVDARFVSIHPFTSAFEPMLFFTDYERRVEDGLRFYRRYFQAAQLLNAHILVLHGDFSRFCYVDLDSYCERFDRLRRVGAEYGVTVAQENVNGYKSGSADFIRGMRERLPEVRFVLDQKQCIRADVPFWTMADAMGDNIVHVHLSDSLPGSDCLLPGAGKVDFRAVLETLRRDFPRAATGVIELYRKNYTHVDELLRAFRDLKSMESDLEKVHDRRSSR